MSMKNDETLYVVFKKYPTDIVDDLLGVKITIPVGYYLVPFPVASDKIIYYGSMMKCSNVLRGLLSFSLN